MTGEKPKLLVVDDVPANIFAMKTVLKDLDAEVYEAGSGKEALALILKHEFALIVMDVQMPDMDGFETARLIRDNEPTKYLPVIFATAYDKDEGLVFEGYETGAVDYLFKPINPVILKSKINVFLSLHRQKADLQKANHKIKETQAHLIQSEKMAALGQLVAGIAHEINNPLTFVITNMYTMKDRLEKVRKESGSNVAEMAGQWMEKASQRLDEAMVGLQRVKELVIALRTFSRLDEGEFMTIDVEESIESALMFLSHKMKNRITVEKRYEGGKELACYAGRLNQVFLNLLSNAVDAIENTGKITIYTEQEKGYFLIHIKDTGEGIPEAIRHRIFEPFFTSKPVGQGTGLGLSISYSILKAHNGDLEVHSTEGEGTEFIMRIPLDGSAEQV